MSYGVTAFNKWFRCAVGVTWIRRYVCFKLDEKKLINFSDKEATQNTDPISYMKVLCCQIAIDGVTTRSAMEDHQTRIGTVIRAACCSQDVDLILLPELSAIEYSNSAFNNLSNLAISTDGWLTESMAELARETGASICFGLPRRSANGIHISQVIVSSDGSVTGYYDKLHIAQFGTSEEKLFFTPGDHVTIFEIGGFRCGIVICYDIRFSEYISAIVRKHELDVILHPVAFCRDGSFASWRNFVCTRALENQIYWLSLNRAGPGWGHSIICPPWFEQESEVIELDESENLEIIELDRRRLRYAEENYPLKLDRLDSYSGIVHIDG